MFCGCHPRIIVPLAIPSLLKLMASGRALSGLLVPALVQTAFDARRRGAIPESARANYDAAVATYRQTSLTAFPQVEDNVAALRILENESHQQAQAVASAKDSLQLFTNRYKDGVCTTCRLSPHKQSNSRTNETLSISCGAG
jgi:outer membrane protein TolC